MENEIVIKICGSYPIDFVKVDIENNPNFVFQNDLGFETINVFDSDGNTASVNSFLECEHYVSGGWDVIPIERAETFYFDLFSIFAVLSVIVGFIFSKKIKILND